MASPPSSLPETWGLNTKANQTKHLSTPSTPIEHPRGRGRSGSGHPPPRTDPQNPPSMTVEGLEPPPLGPPAPRSSQHPTLRTRGEQAGRATPRAPTAGFPEPNAPCITTRNPLYHPPSHWPVAGDLEWCLLSIYYGPDPALSPYVHQPT